MSLFEAYCMRVCHLPSPYATRAAGCAASRHVAPARGCFPAQSERKAISRSRICGHASCRRLSCAAAAAGATAGAAGLAAKLQAGSAPAAAAAASVGRESLEAVHDSVAVTHFKELYIKDFALVAEQRVELQPGLTVITGESGSGKSVLVEALGQLLGGPAPNEAIRPPASSALLEASVAVAAADQAALRRLLGELGVQRRAAQQLGLLRLRRELSQGPDGSVRSRCFVNGCPTSVRVLREVGQLLVDVNGQHAALTLKEGGTRLRLLDKLAGTSAAADELAASLAQWQQAQAQLHQLDALSDEAQRDAMQQLVDQVYGAGVEPGEDRSLRQQLRQLDGRRAAAERCRLVSVGLSGDGGGGIAEALRDVQLQVKQLLSLEERLAAQAAAAAAAERELHSAGNSSTGGSSSNGSSSASAAEEGEEGEEGGSASGMLQAAVGLLDKAQALLDEAEEAVVQYGKQYRFSQPQYDELSARLQQLERLMKQHDATSADELLQMAEEQAAALDLYFQLEGQQEQLRKEEQQLQARLQQQVVELSRRRREAAGKLRAAVEAVLSDLAMSGSRFEARVSWTPSGAADTAGSSGSGSGGSIFVGAAAAAACGEEAGEYRVRPGGSGLDAAEFLFAAGPAEPLRPLSAVASGGESARIMLALKAAPAALLAPPAGSDSSQGGGRSGAEQGASANAAAAAAGGSSGNGAQHQQHQEQGQQHEQGQGQQQGQQIMILDEIDSGVGSRLGQPIGRLLRRMAGSPQGQRAGQILCVSHLPQVAAHAEHHLCVRKAVAADDRMVTRFDRLQERAERLQEISAMLGLPEAAAEEVLQAAAQQ